MKVSISGCTRMEEIYSHFLKFASSNFKFGYLNDSRMPLDLFYCFCVCVTSIKLCWLLSVIFDEYSQVDRIWAILPIIYAFIFAC